MGGWFHASVQTIGRSGGRSATAAASYRAAELIHDERTGENYDYRRKQGVVSKFIAAPDDAPDWIKDRAALWNAVEAAEKRGDSRLARELQLALPSNISAAEREAIVRQIAAELVNRYRVAVDACLHAPHKDGDQRNFHAHMMFTTREIGPAGLTNKTRILDNGKTSGAEIEKIRAYAAATINQCLERNGLAERVDHRSFQRQGIDQEPQQHLGPAASAKERRGEPSRIGDFNRQAEQGNRQRQEFNEKAKVIDLAIEREKRRVAAMERNNDQQKRWKEEQERDRRRAANEAQYRADRAEKERRGYEKWGDQKRADMAAGYQAARASHERYRTGEMKALESRIAHMQQGDRQALLQQQQGIQDRQQASFFRRTLQRLTGQAAQDREQMARITAATAALDKQAERLREWTAERLDMKRRDLERGIREETARFERQYASGYEKREAAGWIIDRPQPHRWKTAEPSKAATAEKLEPAIAKEAQPQTAAEAQQAAAIRQRWIQAKAREKTTIREKNRELAANKGQLAAEAINSSLRRQMNPQARQQEKSGRAAYQDEGRAMAAAMDDWANSPVPQRSTDNQAKPNQDVVRQVAGTAAISSASQPRQGKNMTRSFHTQDQPVNRHGLRGEPQGEAIKNVNAPIPERPQQTQPQPQPTPQRQNEPSAREVREHRLNTNDLSPEHPARPRDPEPQPKNEPMSSRSVADAWKQHLVEKEANPPQPQQQKDQGPQR